MKEWGVKMTMTQGGTETCDPQPKQSLIEPEALGNTWYGSLRPLTNLAQTFQARHLWDLNPANSWYV